MTPEQAARTGFAPTRSERVRGRRWHLALELIATVALVVSIMVAMTAVSMGIARALSPAAETAVGAEPPR